MIARRAPLRRSSLKKVPRGQKPKTLAPRAHIHQRQAIRRRRKRNPIDEPFRVFILALPCAVYEFQLFAYSSPCEGAVQPHHAGVRGLRQKAPERTIIPLCSAHHDRRMPHSVHTLGKGFWTFHGLDKGELIADYNRRFEGQA